MPMPMMIDLSWVARPWIWPLLIMRWLTRRVSSYAVLGLTCSLLLAPSMVTAEMAHPIAMCLEDLDASSPDVRYLRCVALPGNEPGLAMDDEGHVFWKIEGEAACELWVSADQRLILFCPDRENTPSGGGEVPVIVTRSGRSLDAPRGKPVVLLDGDQLDVAGRRFQVHVHGQTEAVAPPSYLTHRVRSGSGFARTAAAVALGAVLGTAGCHSTSQIEVRDQPPQVPAVVEEPSQPDAGGLPPDQATPDPDPPQDQSSTIEQGGTDEAARHDASPSTPIEVRDNPPRKS